MSKVEKETADTEHGHPKVLQEVALDFQFEKEQYRILVVLPITPFGMEAGRHKSNVS